MKHPRRRLFHQPRSSVRRSDFGWILAILMLPLLALTPGCKSDSSPMTHEQQLQAAYLAGQQAAQAQAQQQRPMGISVIGEVVHNQILWRPGLTLAEGIVEAQFVGAIQPRAIFVIRGGNRYEINVRALLNGRDNPELEPGDVVDIRR